MDDVMIISLLLSSVWIVVRYALLRTQLVGLRHAIINVAAMVVGDGVVIVW